MADDGDENKVNFVIYQAIRFFIKNSVIKIDINLHLVLS